MAENARILLQWSVKAKGATAECTAATPARPLGKPTTSWVLSCSSCHSHLQTLGRYCLKMIYPAIAKVIRKFDREPSGNTANECPTSLTKICKTMLASIQILLLRIKLRITCWFFSIALWDYWRKLYILPVPSRITTYSLKQGFSSPLTLDLHPR